MFRVRSLFHLALLLGAIALVGCGDDAPKKLTPTPVVIEPTEPDDEPDKAAPAASSASNSGGGAAAGADPDAVMDFTARLVTDEVERGEPVLIELELSNPGDLTLNLVSPEEMIAKRLEVHVERGGEKYVSSRRLAPAGQVMAVPLRGGEVIRTQIDIRTMIDTTKSYLEGRVAFRVVFRGAADVMPDDPSLWNSSGNLELRSKRMDLDVLEEPWVRDLEVSDDAFADVAGAIVRWQPGSRTTDQTLDIIRNRETDGIRSLCILARDAGSAEPDIAARAGKALALIRLIGKDALPVLLELHAVEHPAFEMVRDIVDADARDVLGTITGPEAQAVRDVASRASTATLFSLDLKTGDATSAINYMLDARGRLSVATKDADGETVRRTRELDNERLMRLKSAIWSARPWCWRQLRSDRRKDEGDVWVTVWRGQTKVLEVVVPEHEALHENPIVTELIDAFHAMAKDIGYAKTALVRESKAGSGR